MAAVCDAQQVLGITTETSAIVIATGRRIGCRDPGKPVARPAPRHSQESETEAGQSPLPSSAFHVSVSAAAVRSDQRATHLFRLNDRSEPGRFSQVPCDLNDMARCGGVMRTFGRSRPSAAENRMLLPTEWAARIGLNPSLMNGDPDQSRAIGAVIAWRWLPLGLRNAWCQQFMVSGRGYPLSASTAFWRELENKRAGLFGSGTSTAVDPLVAYRHPWCLSNAEFSEARARIIDGRTPNTLDDDRVRISTLAKWIGPLFGVAGPLAGATGVLAVPTAAAAGLFGFAAAVDAGSEMFGDALESEAFKRQIPALKRVYQSEQQYRTVELRAPLAA